MARLFKRQAHRHQYNYYLNRGLSGVCRKVLEKKRATSPLRMGQKQFTDVLQNKKIPIFEPTKFARPETVGRA